jgi:tetratricopeptide (TPR) repeat protein
VEVGERAGNPELALVGHVHRACDLLESGRVDEVRREAEICDEIVEQLGQPLQRYFVAWLHATIARLEGRFDDSERLADEALDIAVAADHPDAMIVWGTQALILGFERGKAEHLLDAAERLLEELPDLSAWPAAVSLVRAVAGRFDAAHDLLRTQVARLDQLSFDAIWTPALMALTEVMRMVDDAAGAQQVYEMLEPYGDTICVISLNLSEMGPVHRSLGVLATLLGEHERAERHFERALEMSTEIGAPPHVARASTDYARMLLGRGKEGDAARARDLLAGARTTATELGMAGLLRDIAALED